MKKWLIALVLVAIVGFIGYKVGMNYVSDKVMSKLQDELITPEEMEAMKRDPEVQQAIKQNFSQEEIKRLLPEVDVDQIQPTQTEPTGEANKKEEPKKLTLTRKDAEQLIMSKFSLSEIKSMADKARKGLTEADKQEIMAKVKSKLTAEQYEALKVRVLIEIMKKNA